MTSHSHVTYWGLLALLQAYLVIGYTTEPPDGLRGPIFLEEPPSIYVIPNTKGALIPCGVYGNPAPQISWTYGNDQTVETQLGIVEVLHNNSLYFHPFDDDDVSSVYTQVYRCVAENVIGRVASRSMRTSAVIVDQLETFSVGLNHAWVMRGGTAVFTCNINPPIWRDYVRVTGWTRGSQIIRREEDRVSITPDDELILRDVRDTDGIKDFQCTAASAITGTHKSSPKAKLRIHDPPAGGRSPSIEVPSLHVEANLGDSVELPCVSDGWPLPSYRWYKDNALVDLAESRISQVGGNLVINLTRISDSGEYRCNVSNPRGSSTAERILTIRAPLRATITPATQTIDSGQTAFFNCSVYGNPITDVKWYKNGKPLVEDDRVIFQSDTLLQIMNVHRHDQGMYQCFVENAKVEAQGISQLLLGAAHPTMIDGFGDQYAQTGQRTSIRCIAAGNPTPSINWLLDGEPVRSQSHVNVGDFTTISGDVVSYVNITSVRLQDGGEYRCNASNEVGQAEHTARLNVYGIPYIRVMKNITATANEPLSIKCYVTGYPIDTITWSRKGRPLPLNHLQQVVNGTLTILKVQKLYDAGKYTCAASNSDGQGMTRSVYIDVLEPPVIDPFRIPPRKQGDRVTLSCAVSSGDLPIDIKWTKDGLEIPHDMGIVVETSGSYSSLLKIGDVSPKHDGNYTCHASNSAASTSYTAELHVDVAPMWDVEPQDSSVERLKTVWIECKADGIPDPDITWSKHMKHKVGFLPAFSPLDLTDTRHYHVFENGTLRITDTLEADDGNYLCRADNKIGHGISKIISLIVKVPARFDAAQKNYTVLRGHNKTMDCQAIGDKPLSVSWAFHNRTVGNGRVDSRHTVNVQDTLRGKLSQMVLRPAQRDDTGPYTCTAANKFGSDSMTMWLTVLEPPDAPANLSIVDIQSRHVVLKWSKPFNGNSQLTNYVIEYQNTTGELRGPVRNITVQGNVLTATLDGLHPSFLYNMRIRANNKIGLGLTSHQVSAKLLEEAPSGAPTEVEVKAIGSQKLQVMWKPPPFDQRNGVILGYFVGYKDTGTAAQIQFISKDIIVDDEDDPEGVVSILIPNLKKFTEYSVHVKAQNKKGMGPASPDMKVSTLEDVPSKPPMGVQASAISSQTIKVIWGPPPLFTLHGVLQGYKVLYKPVRKDEDETDANFVKSTKLEVTMEHLEKFTNYSIQVLAFTRKGEGVRSRPIFVLTMEDAPGRPAGIKALPVNNNSVVVSWQSPVKPNGILTNYNLYYSNTTAAAQEVKVEVPPTDDNFNIRDLEANVEYWVRVTASTRMGEGESTQILTVMPINQVPAKITSFSAEKTAAWQESVLLPCTAIGDPEPEIEWTTRHGVILNNDRRKILENGSLYLESVIGTEAANYTCKAQNKYGSDVITYSLSVQEPPKPPILSLAAVTSSTIQVNWLSGSNGGSTILSFSLRHRKEHEVWQEINLGPKNRTYTAAGLLCGTSYKFSITAVNLIGRSETSNVKEAKTNGSAPIMPEQSDILTTVNVTSVELDMRTWLTDFCTIKFYSIEYQIWGDNPWVEVTNSISWNTTLFTVEDLHPATWYLMKITAHSDAGSTECILKFATLTYSGSTLEPLYVMHKNEAYFYENLRIMVPLCGAVVVLLILSAGLALYCSRRRQLIRYKENSSNIRRDITAETSLMNDLDKRINYELDSPQDCRFNSRNVNLLISLNSDENLASTNDPWCFNDSSKTNSDNASIGRSDEDANINPYATFNELKLVFSENPTYHKADPDSDEDSVSLEKAEAQKAMLVALESADDKKYAAKGTTKQSGADQHSYDNQGVILSPRKYASADQIHALFSMAPPRPQSAYSKNRSHGTRSTPSDKGSQRHSLISSVTTVSSSRDELLEAFENLNRNPPPPVVYETEADSLSQPTDSSTGTEPGICLFTQSPPQPDEQREASCEVPRYETSEECHYHNKEDRRVTATRHHHHGDHLDTRALHERHVNTQRHHPYIDRSNSRSSDERHIAPQRHPPLLDPPSNRGSEQMPVQRHHPLLEQSASRCSDHVTMQRQQHPLLDQSNCRNTADRHVTPLLDQSNCRNTDDRHVTPHRHNVPMEHDNNRLFDERRGATHTYQTHGEAEFGRPVDHYHTGLLGHHYGDPMDAKTTPKRSKACAVQKQKEMCGKTGSLTRGASKPKSSEEVTYVFSVEDSPGHAKKPQSFEEKLLRAREGKETSIWRKGGRRTPHARTRYDTSLQTPGSADDKPLVSAQVMSARDMTPEEEESVSLLDRYYRPVAGRRSREGTICLDDDDDKGYTDTFTIV